MWATSVAHFTNFSFEFFKKNFHRRCLLLILYQKKVKYDHKLKSRGSCHNRPESARSTQRSMKLRKLIQTSWKNKHQLVYWVVVIFWSRTSPLLEQRPLHDLVVMSTCSFLDWSDEVDCRNDAFHKAVQALHLSEKVRGRKCAKCTEIPEVSKHPESSLSAWFMVVKNRTTVLVFKPGPVKRVETRSAKAEHLLVTLTEKKINTVCHFLKSMFNINSNNNNPGKNEIKKKAKNVHYVNCTVQYTIAGQTILEGERERERERERGRQREKKGEKEERNGKNFLTCQCRRHSCKKLRLCVYERLLPRRQVMFHRSIRISNFARMALITTGYRRSLGLLQISDARVLRRFVIFSFSDCISWLQYQLHVARSYSIVVRVLLCRTLATEVCYYQWQEYIRTRVYNAWSLHYGPLARRNFK